MDRIRGYYELLKLPYDGAVKFLINKYGIVSDDYYREESYSRFLEGHIQNITKGKYSRTDDGLYTHHIDEYRYSNLSNSYFIKTYEYPYEVHKKERLVYCDLIEHAILHVLINKEKPIEDSVVRSSPGYKAFLQPTIVEWYIDEVKPQPNWMINCYNKAYLSPLEACKLCNHMDVTAGFNQPFPESPEKYFEQERLLEVKKEKMKQDMIKSRKEFRESDKREFEELKKIARNLHAKSPRRSIIDVLYKFKSREGFIDYKELRKDLNIYYKEELIELVNEYAEKEYKIQHFMKSW